jgi:hypothetical protein
MILSMTEAIHPNARKTPSRIATRVPVSRVPKECKLVALELSMLSKGLPPPLPTFPDSCDCAPAGELLVLLVAVDAVLDDVSILMLFEVADDSCDDRDVGAEFDCVVVGSVLLGLVFMLVSVNNPLVTGVSEDRTMVLCPMVWDGVPVIDIVTVSRPPPAPAVRPVVVVTTATLHSNWIALPS